MAHHRRVRVDREDARRDRRLLHPLRRAPGPPHGALDRRLDARDLVLPRLQDLSISLDPLGGAGVTVALAALVLRRPLASVPENALKFAVGVLLGSFGAFWIGEGLGVHWPGADLLILGLAGGFLILSLLTVVALRTENIQRGAPESRT